MRALGDAAIGRAAIEVAALDSRIVDVDADAGGDLHVLTIHEDVEVGMDVVDQRLVSLRRETGLSSKRQGIPGRRPGNRVGTGGRTAYRADRAEGEEQHEEPDNTPRHPRSSLLDAGRA